LEESGSGFFIDQFVSGGPKSSAFSVICPSTGKRTTKCKVKGIILNYEKSKVVNFTASKYMILEDAPLMHVYNPKKIKRKPGGIVVSEPETKEYKVVFKKLMDNVDSLSYYMRNLFIYLFCISRGAIVQYNSFHSITLKMQHPFT